MCTDYGKTAVSGIYFYTERATETKNEEPKA